MSRMKWVGIALIACAATGVAVAGAADVGRAGGKSTARAATGAASNARNVQIIVFAEAPLATYRGEIKGLRAAGTKPNARGKQRLDTQGAEATRYVAHLKAQQAKHLGAIERTLGRGVNVRTSMQLSINAVVAEMTAAEAKKIAGMPGVKFVEAYREYALDTDHGPQLIGAPNVWDGSSGAGGEFQGEGMVAGIIDSGINYGSPSFAATDPVDGYQHVNPLGNGVYLGQCVAGGVDEGNCSAKVIGGYDFVCGEPANQCGQPNIRDEPSFGDSDSHGSHTASTVVGNHRNVTFRGVATQIAGVAPRANVIAYDVCYHLVTTGQGLCPNVSTLAAIEQATEDGVDVINYSIGGGGSPWTEAISLAFLGAVEAGTYVAASAGNSGPANGTTGHRQPWVATTAAAQHGRGDFVFLAAVTGPAPVPAPLAAVVVNPGSGGVEFTGGIPATTPLTVSPTYGNTTTGDLCAAPAAGAFTGQIVLATRGVCSFTIKTNNAAAGGALALFIVNNTTGAILPSVPGTTIPAFGLTQADGNAMRDFRVANASATANVGFPAVAQPNVADQLAAFSSRGPSGFDVLKPDITGPGVNILAVTAGTTVTGFENQIGLLSGTSMSSPHHAGAAALVRQARPGWSPSEIKSALMMTSETAVLHNDGVTPANPFDMGAGRVQVDAAVNAGLVLDETAADFLAANPAAGGDPKTLNMPSIYSMNCSTTCTFTRTFRNPHATSPLWNVSLAGVQGTVSPRLLKVPAGGSATVTITIDPASLPAGFWSFGTLQLSPGSVRRPATASTLHLPVAVAKP